MATTVTQPLRDEHAHLLPHIEALREVADGIGESGTEVLRQEVSGVVSFLTDHLIPHAQAEDAVLYPVVAEAIGAPEATATMRRDHVEVSRLTGELVALRPQLTGATLEPATATALRRLLYGLYALVKVHFAKEEEIYLPILDRHLSPEDAKALFVAMEEHAGPHAAEATAR
jgi:hemerythrin-like domain-containing protein